jgi:histidyl-tRNA synthetase
LSNDINKIFTVKGMYDVLPDEVWIWQRLENIISKVFTAYHFQEIRFPVVEETRLFQTAIGEVTDVVEKEMYNFKSRKGLSLTLRPEGTAGCVRAVVQNNLCNRGLIQKLWYCGPMFRYEQPQKGRNRQFTQVGAEIFNMENPEADAELLLMSSRLWKQLGLPNIRLEINSLGTDASRSKYRQVLIDYFKQNIDVLDEDAKRRLESNPLRILDSKNPAMRSVIENAPLLTEYLDEESIEHFTKVKSILDQCGIAYIENPKLVRGLDYYCKTVFEWITDDLGAQGTICAGGRYDTLVERQGGKPTPAVGFAMGLDRIVELIKDLSLWQQQSSVDAVLIVDNVIDSSLANQFSEKIRDSLRGINLYVNQSGGSFKSQFKKADKLNADFAIILGENEIQNDFITVKSLKNKELGQQELQYNDFVEFMKNNTNLRES